MTIALIILALYFTVTFISMIWLPHSKFKVYSYNVWMGLDKFVNGLTGGDHNQTISARAAIYKDEYKIACAIWWVLEKIDNGHGVKSIQELAQDDREGKYDLINYQRTFLGDKRNGR